MVCIDLEAAVKKNKKNYWNCKKNHRKSSEEPSRAFLEFSGEGRSFFGPWWDVLPSGQVKGG